MSQLNDRRLNIQLNKVKGALLFVTVLVHKYARIGN